MLKLPSALTIKKSAILAGLTFFLYVRVIHGQYLWDDDDYVIHNITLIDLSGLREIWLHFGRLPQYYPLTYSSFWLEYQLWGLNLTGYHCTNILLHAANGILAWQLLERLKIKHAWFIGLLFSLHPVNVESVAWITERKNTLSGFFYLAAAIAYLRSRYFLAYFFFLAALGSKTVTATLPITLFLILWWRDGKVSMKDMGRLLIFIITALFFSSLTIKMENVHVVLTGIAEWNFSFWHRVLIAGRALWFYISKIIVPHPLIFIYPKWPIDPSSWQQWTYPISSLLLVGNLWLFRKRVGRGPSALLAIFAVTLLPALGFKNFFPMRFSFVADHFQYLATIPGIVFFTLLAAKVIKNTSIQKAAAYLVLATAAVLAWRHEAAFMSQEALWKDTLAKNPNAWIAHNNLGTLYVDKKMEKEAKFHFREALKLKPDHAEAISNLGLMELTAGRAEAAIPYFQKAAELQPNFGLFEMNWGVALFSMNKLEEAEKHYRKALRINPRFGEAFFNLGNLFLQKGMTAEAEAEFQKAVYYSPDYGDAHAHLGYCYAQRGKADEAIVHYRTALKIDPNQANVHNNLANALSAQGLYQEAEIHYKTAMELDPSAEAFRINYAEFIEKRKMQNV